MAASSNHAGGNLFSATVVIDIGSSEGIESVPDSVLNTLATMSKHALITKNSRQDRLAELRETLRRTFPALPWPRKTNSGNVRDSRKLEILPGSVFVDPLTRKMLRGFRVESGQDDTTDGFILRRRTLRCFMFAPINENFECKLSTLTTLVFLRIPGIAGMELVYCEMPAAVAEARVAEKELTGICEFRYGVDRPVSTRLWELIDGVNRDWLFVGLDFNVTKTLQVVFDPGALSVFLFADAELSRKDAVPMDRKRLLMLDRLTSARSTKIACEFATPMLVASEMSSADADSRRLFREEKFGGVAAQGYDVYEDMQSYGMNLLVAERAAQGCSLMELETVFAVRPRCTIDLETIDDDDFFWYHKQCSPETIAVPQTSMKRIASCVSRLASNGARVFGNHVQIHQGFLYFSPVSLFFSRIEEYQQ